MHKPKGDTLIEVALAIGIFSMVAVAVVAVVSGSTSSAQSALELTITREEIDAQAEALRFIQSSYIAGGMANISGASQQKYAEIWNVITSHALDPTDSADEFSSNKEYAEAVLNYNPATCEEVYDFSDNANYNSVKRQKGFIVNTRNLGIAPNENEEFNENFIKQNIVISANATNFQPTTTYPRILFSGDTDALYNSNSSTVLERAEGLFIVAVKDSGSIVVDSSGTIDKKPAYYDFYIRSCWFAPGSDRPSTISTVIRLQDPAAITY